MRRREFLVTGSLALAAWRLGAQQRRRAARIERPGIQLYSVRDAFARDPAGTLAALGAMGYREVEFAGFQGRTPAQLTRMLADAELAAPSAHVDLPDLGADWPKLVEFGHALGVRYLVIASIPETERTPDAMRRNVELMAKASSTAAAAGITLGYHAHEFEFRSRMPDGRAYYDFLLASLPASAMVFELDLYWVTKGGRDAKAYFKEWPGRFPMVHMKDMAPDGSITTLGKGTIDFQRILEDHERAGIRHYFAEDDDPAQPMTFAREAAAYLRQLRF